MSELLNKKIAAYFSRPPWYAWSAIRKEPFISSTGDVSDEARELLDRLGISPESLSDNISVAGLMASSLDMWPYVARVNGHPCRSPELFSNQQIQRMHKLNAFAPWLKYSVGIDQVSKDDVNKYVTKLTNVAQGNLKYHLLYFFSPLLWYEQFKGVPPLAMPGASLSTTFDFGEAAAALLNIINCKEEGNGKCGLEFHGSLAIIEIPSIQEFILYSRKTRDLWASSWLSSVLLWKAIETFVLNYGPDVVLRPELSLNSFFIAWLYNMVNDQNLRSQIKKYAAEFAGMHEDPKTSVMSEKIIMFLPDGAETARDKLENGFKEGWKIVASEALAELKDSTEYIKKAVELPPVLPIINFVDVGKAFAEYVEALQRSREEISEIDIASGCIPLELLLFFEYLYRKSLVYERIKFSYGTPIADAVQEKTQHEYEMCTVCGVLPSELYYYSDDKISSERSGDPEDRLCPYCAVKRNIKGDVFKKIMGDLRLSVFNNTFRFPSTSELAMADYLDHINDESKKVAAENASLSPLLAEKLCGCYSGKHMDCEELPVYNKDKLKKYGNTYYAILKADGDFMGKGYWRGNLMDQNGEPLNLEKYLEYAVDNETLQGKNILNTIKSISGQVSVLRKDLYGDDSGLPLTPVYAYSISRSLVLQSILDSEMLEMNRGVAVYAGGDDLLAFLPAIHHSEINMEENPEAPALKALMSTRKAYWYHADPGNADVDGFKVKNGLLVDSLRAYGRSYSLFVAHYKDPLTVSVSVAGDLLELKDFISGKDAVFISSGRGIGNYSYSLLRLSKKGRLDMQPLELMEKIMRLMEKEEISKNLLYDVMNLSDYRGKEGIYRYLVMRAVKRNLTKQGSDSEELVNLAETLCEENVCETSGSERKKGKCEGSSTDPCKDRDVFLNALLAVYHLR